MAFLDDIMKGIEACNEVEITAECCKKKQAATVAAYWGKNYIHTTKLEAGKLPGTKYGVYLNVKLW